MASALQKLPRLAVEALVTLCVLALLVVISEGVLRLFAPGEEQPSSAKSVHAESLPRLHHTKDLAQPHVRGLNAGALYETNSAGFRGPERSRETPAAVDRIAVIGDSTAMGWGVEEEDTYAARLDLALDSDTGTDTVEVLNFGLAGLNIEEVIQRLEDLGLGFDPDVVVYGFALNDIKGPHYRASLDPEYARSFFEHESNSRLWQWLRPLWLALVERAATPHGTFAYELDDNYFRNPEAWASLRTQVERLAKLGRERDFCTLFLVQAQIQALHFLHPYQRHYERVGELADENGFHTLHSLERLSEEDASGLWVSESDHHGNARAHAIFAEIIAEGIRGLPPECWESEVDPPETREGVDS